MLVTLFIIFPLALSYSQVENLSQSSAEKIAMEALPKLGDVPKIEDVKELGSDPDTHSSSVSAPEKDNSFLRNIFINLFVYFYNSFFEYIIQPIRNAISKVQVLGSMFPFNKSDMSKPSADETEGVDVKTEGPDLDKPKLEQVSSLDIKKEIKDDDKEKANDSQTASSSTDSGKQGVSSGSNAGGGSLYPLGKGTNPIAQSKTLSREDITYCFNQWDTVKINNWCVSSTRPFNVYIDSSFGRYTADYPVKDKDSGDKTIEIGYPKICFIDNAGNFSPKPEAFKLLMDFIMCCIVKSNTKYFRIEMKLDGSAKIIIYSSYKKGEDNKLPQGGNYDHEQKGKLRQKAGKLLKNGLTKRYSGRVNYLGCYPNSQDRNRVKVMGTWERSSDNEITKNNFLLCEVSKNKNGNYRKDIMEMWRDWNDKQRLSYCTLIAEFLKGIQITDFKKWNLKWNRALEINEQSQDLNHIQIYTEDKLEDVSPFMAEYKKGCIYSDRQKKMAKMLENSFSLSMEDFINSYGDSV